MNESFKLHHSNCICRLTRLISLIKLWLYWLYRSNLLDMIFNWEVVFTAICGMDGMGWDGIGMDGYPRSTLLIKGDAERPTRPPKFNYRGSMVTSTTKESEICNLQPEKAILSSRLTLWSWSLQLFSCVSEHTNSSSSILTSVRYM